MTADLAAIGKGDRVITHDDRVLVVMRADATWIETDTGGPWRRVDGYVRGSRGGQGAWIRALALGDEERLAAVVARARVNDAEAQLAAATRSAAKARDDLIAREAWVEDARATVVRLREEHAVALQAWQRAKGEVST